MRKCKSMKNILGLSANFTKLSRNILKHENDSRMQPLIFYKFWKPSRGKTSRKRGNARSWKVFIRGFSNPHNSCLSAFASQQQSANAEICTSLIIPAAGYYLFFINYHLFLSSLYDHWLIWKYYYTKEGTFTAVKEPYFLTDKTILPWTLERLSSISLSSLLNDYIFLEIYGAIAIVSRYGNRRTDWSLLGRRSQYRNIRKNQLLFFWKIQ
jgi:hypothetical protein